MLGDHLSGDNVLTELLARARSSAWMPAGAIVAAAQLR